MKDLGIRILRDIFVLFVASLVIMSIIQLISPYSLLLFYASLDDSQTRVCTDERGYGIVVQRDYNQRFDPYSYTSSVDTFTTGDMTLGIGQQGCVSMLSITLNSLIQDSRCPVDVQCIQTGAVNTNVTFIYGTQTNTHNISSDEVPYRFGPYAISITTIMPDRHSKKHILPDEYHVTFHIKKVE